MKTRLIYGLKFEDDFLFYLHYKNEIVKIITFLVSTVARNSINVCCLSYMLSWLYA